MLLVLYGNLSIELTRTREPPTPGHVRPHLGPPEARVRSPPGDREAPGAPEGGGVLGLQSHSHESVRSGAVQWTVHHSHYPHRFCIL